MKAFGSSAINLFKNIGKIIAGALTLNPDKIKAGISGVKIAIAQGLSEIGGEVAKYGKEAGQEIAKNVSDALSETINGQLEKKTPEQIKKGLLSLGDSLKETAKSVGKSIGASVSDGIAEGASKVIGRKKATVLNTDGLSSGVANVSDDPSNTITPRINSTEFDADAENMRLKLQRFNDNASSIIQGSLTNTFAGIGDAIGSAMINGGNLAQSLGSVLLGGIASIATQLGQQAIAIGVGMLAIKASFANPLTAIAAGVALVAIGGAIKATQNTVQGGGSRRGGGSNGASSSGFSGSSGGGNFGASSGGNSLQNVVFEIQGTKLVGVLSNTLSRNRSLGGSLSLT
jgi:hypothetical protein